MSDERKIFRADDSACRLVSLPDGLFIEGLEIDGGMFLVRRNTITELVINCYGLCVIRSEGVKGGVAGRAEPSPIATGHTYDAIFARMGEEFVAKE